MAHHRNSLVDNMTDPTIDLDEGGSVKMLRVTDPEVREVLVPVQEDDTLEEPMTPDVITKLTEEELEKNSTRCLHLTKLDTIDE